MNRLCIHTMTTKPWSLDDCARHYPRAGVSGITYGVEWTPGLAPANWTPLIDTGIGSTHTFSLPVVSNQNCFFRFVITAP